VQQFLQTVQIQYLTQLLQLVAVQVRIELHLTLSPLQKLVEAAAEE
jgi:hypothetical protein